MKKRAPNWSRDELILALDLYFREPNARGNEEHPETIALSSILNQLPIHSTEKHGSSFRNPNGVGMKLSNFLRFDPSYKGKGLERGGAEEAAVWAEFSNNIPNLKAVAAAIVANYKELPPASASIEESDSEDEALEGAVLTRIHKRRERNRKIVKKKKESVLRDVGALKCEVCDFDFASKYGERGYGFAECHHDVPVSELRPGQKTKISDLCILCANCHRMVHRRKPWLTVAELKEILKTCQS